MKSKVKFGKGPKSSSRPTMSPPGAMPPTIGARRPVIPRPMGRRPGRPPVRAPPRGRPPARPVGRPVAKAPAKNAAFDDTMKKLREMSK